MAKKDEVEISVTDYLDYKKVQEEYAPELMEVIKRKVTIEAAKKAGIRVTAQQLQKTVDNFRHIHSLQKASDTEIWMNMNAVTPDMLEEYIKTNILISKFKDHLEKKASKTKYLSHPAVKDAVRDLIYEDWLAKNIKA
jgi:hypothetical protein